MNKIQELLSYLLENPRATNSEIEKNTSLSNGLIRKYILRLNSQGRIDVSIIEGIRTIDVYSIDEERPDFKRCIYKMMVDKYIEDFEEAEFFQDRVEIGKMITRLLEKL